MAKKKNLDRPEKVRTTLEELEVLSRLKHTVEWSIVKRLAQRYVRNLQKVSFKLLETDSHYLAVRHAELAGQSLGVRTLIKMVENSGKKLDRLEESGKK